jgi:autotransporter-associated beta strand protein
VVPDAAAGTTLQFASIARATGATALFRGSNLGLDAGPGVASIFSTGSLTFVGAGTADTTNKGILPWALIDPTNTGRGVSFATADTSTSALRPLRPSEYAATLTVGQNVNLSGFETTVTSLSLNSLTLSSGGGIEIASPTAILSIGASTIAGGILALPGNLGISGGLLSSGSTGDLVFHTLGDLNISSSIVGAPVTSSPYVTKTGPGTLSLTGIGYFTGQTVVNEGTLALRAGNNTLGGVYNGNNFLTVNGGRLDLGGNSQYISGLISDNQVANGGGLITGSLGSTLVMNQDNSTRPWSGRLSGDLAFQRGGTNVSNFLSDNDYTGPTLISGGQITLLDGGRFSRTSAVAINYATLNILDQGAAAHPDRINNAAGISLNGGRLYYLGRAQNCFHRDAWKPISRIRLQLAGNPDRRYGCELSRADPRESHAPSRFQRHGSAV